MTKHLTSRWHLLFIATIFIGIVSGFGGMFLAILLHFIQHLAYEHTVFPILADEHFLEVVTGSTAPRRVVALLLCGLIAGFGWWAVFVMVVL